MHLSLPIGKMCMQTYRRTYTKMCVCTSSSYDLTPLGWVCNIHPYDHPCASRSACAQYASMNNVKQSINTLNSTQIHTYMHE